ncbi:bifunctional aspartate kinase/diaminopimelate decarboxylase [Luteimonas sp. e5]
MSQSQSSLPWLVLKFGGTSVSSRMHWDMIARIAADRAQDARVLVVVSALAGVTNELMAIAAGDDIPGRIEALTVRHRALAEELGLDAQAVIGEQLDALRATGNDPRAGARPFGWQADVLAHGELLASRLGVAYLQAQGMDCAWCDARDWLDAQVLPNASDWACHLAASCSSSADDAWRERFNAQRGRVLLTQGFIARHADGGNAVLGRGGSDTSAACFGALLGAQRVEIWTDVPGMFSANPREVPEARLLARLDYAEAQEISTTGGKVLHPRAIAPCREARVPMAILDTARPHLPGTRIEGSAQTVPGVKAISRRDGIVLVSMESVGMWQQVGFLADVFERFKRHGLSVDLIGSSETNVTVSLDPSENLVTTDVLSRLSEDLAEVCRVKVIAPCSAITLVGLGMRSLLDKLSDVWATFGRERVHLISQSSNNLNLTFVVDEADADGLVPHLHVELIRSGAMPVRAAGVFGPSWRQLDASDALPLRRWWQQPAMRERLLACAESGTPRYVYHLPTLRRQAQRLNAIADLDGRYFAIKANPHPALLRELHALGFGLECVSLAEIEHVLASVPGIDPARLLFTPSFAPRAEYQAAFEHGVRVTLDNVEQLQRWPEVFRGRECWLRVDLGRGDGHHAKVVTGGSASKFGLPLARVQAFIETARTLDLSVIGLHAHLGSGIDSPAHWAQVHAELATLADGIGTIETLNLGGGLPIPYLPDEPEFDLDAWARALAEVKSAFPRYRVVIEPGRFIAAQCGVLLARITQVVEKDGIRRIGMDAGMNALMRPALYDAWHDIRNLSRLDDDNELPHDVVGPVCESGDVLGHARDLPAASREGDVMLVADAGAYGHVMASHYNLRPLPAEEVIDD